MRGKRVKHDHILANELYDAGVRHFDGQSKESFRRRFRRRKHKH